MNYKEIYRKLCERGKLRKKSKETYLESHHIIPTFFFVNNKRNLRYGDGIFEGDGEHVGNKTYLTAREHFIAHLLLCKIWKDTKWEYRCYLSLKMFVNAGKRNSIRNVFDQSSRVYEKYKFEINSKISKGKSGTMPAKCAKTGDRLGIVPIDHPKVKSGEWVHITKGIKKTKEQKLRNAKSGLENSNSKYSDADLLESYKKCCYHYGKLVNGTIWIPFSKNHNLPYITSWKQFRFNNKAWSGMVEDFLKIAEKEQVEIEIITNYFSKEWREFVKEEKKKWV